MAKAGAKRGVFNGSAMKGNNNIKLGVGRKVSHFNSKLPGGGGTTNKGRVVVRSNARNHGQHGFGIVTKGGQNRAGGKGLTGFKS
jgi:hypothetical protein